MPVANTSMIRPAYTHILAQEEGPAAAVYRAEGRAPVLLVCEHASSFVPASLSGLGLAPADRLSHAVWDIGAVDMAMHIADLLDAPLVHSRVSRLVYDCNRPPSAASAFPEKSETIEILGNRQLSENDKAARIREVYEPFRQLVASTLDSFATRPAMITIHTFTPTWFGSPRLTELGILHDEDDQLAEAVLAAARSQTSLRAELNQPYAAVDGVTHTLHEHAIPRGLENVMIEVRNDLVSDQAGADRIGTMLASVFAEALNLPTTTPQGAT
jgi:predicted N-formylglutamate amidohydrolase